MHLRNRRHNLSRVALAAMSLCAAAAAPGQFSDPMTARRRRRFGYGPATAPRIRLLPAAGIFDDVPASGFAADWIEDLRRRAITGGCSATPLLYCPGVPVTRGQIAAFLVRTFGFD
jgi:hypothetical protein